MSASTVPWHTLTPPEAVAQLGVDAAEGLGDADVAERRRRSGPNEIAAPAAPSRLAAFAREYADAGQLLLAGAGAASLWPLHHPGEGLALLGVTVVNAVAGVAHAGPPAAPVLALRGALPRVARARRDGRVRRLAAGELVVGDVVELQAGDVVPADGRLLTVAGLEVDESAITGELLPVAKDIDPVAAADPQLGARTDMVFMTTRVVRGSARLVVTATGGATEAARIARAAEASPGPPAPLTSEVHGLALRLAGVCAVAVVVALVAAVARRWSADAVVGLVAALAVACAPTALRAALMAVVADGRRALAAAGVAVRRPLAAETLGRVTDVMADETAPLRRGRLTATELAIPGRRYRITGGGDGGDGVIRRVAGQGELDLEPFLQPLVLASEAVVTAGVLDGDPTEGALVTGAEKGGVDASATREAYPRLAAIRDPTHGLTATFHRMFTEDGVEVVRCFAWGPPEELLARATAYLDPSLQAADLDADAVARYRFECRRMAAKGLRVVATARRDIKPVAFAPSADGWPLVADLTMLAVVGMVDPLRPFARSAVATLAAAGVAVRMATRDPALAAEALARRLGLSGTTVTGAQLARLPAAGLGATLYGACVISRAAPEDRARVVDVLRRGGHVVAVTGDGLDDAPALARADCAMAMADGSPAARAAADLVLRRDEPAVLVEAVEVGRGLRADVARAAQLQRVSALGLMTAFAAAAVLGVQGGTPLLVPQLLWLALAVLPLAMVGLRRSGRPGDRPAGPGVAAVVVLQAVALVAVVAWAADRHDDATAHTMALATAALAGLAYAMTLCDGLRTVLSLGALRERRFARAAAAAVGVLVLGTEVEVLRHLAGTVSLDPGLWALCAAAALPVLAAGEARRRALSRR